MVTLIKVRQVTDAKYANMEKAIVYDVRCTPNWFERMGGAKTRDTSVYSTSSGRWAHYPTNDSTPGWLSSTMDLLASMHKEDKNWRPVEPAAELPRARLLDGGK